MQNKPWDGFPLTKHKSGQWAKKIKGRTVYFGTDPQEALSLYLDERDDLMAGRVPRTRQEVGTVTVGDLIKRFLATKQAKVDDGTMQQRSYDEYESTCNRVKAPIGDWRALTDLRPDDFAKIKAALCKGRGPVSQKTELTRARSLFRYANKSGITDKNIPYEIHLELPAKRDTETLETRMFTAKQINALFAKASPQMKAMILLGINCGFGNTDIALLTWEFLDLDRGMHFFKRPKTRTERRCPLWPETINALEAIRADRDLVFLTKYGNPWEASAIGHEFKKLLKECKLYRKGNTFYSLRRTFETIGAATGEQVAVDFIMGHCGQGMRDIYRQRVFGEPLLRVTKFVREWLLGQTTLDSFAGAFGPAVSFGVVPETPQAT